MTPSEKQALRKYLDRAEYLISKGYANLPSDDVFQLAEILRKRDGDK